jgi:glucose-1-phosphatase
VGGVASLQEMVGNVTSEEVWDRWLSCPWARRFEMGECSEAEFSVGFVAEWNVDIAPERFLEIFREWPIGPYSATTEVLTEVRQSVPIGCLSNTNSVHWEHQTSRWPVLGMFDFRFLSFELGLVKPDAAIFHAVAEQLPFQRDRVLYLDDVAQNSEAARSYGFRSRQVLGIDEVATVLREVGLVDAD